MHIGDLEIHLVSDGYVWVDPGGPFGLVPRALYQRVIPPNHDNLVPEMLTCLLVRSEGRTIVVDTGLGPRLDEKAAAQWRIERPRGDLVAGLARLGVSPEQVDVVINTHLHSDHCAGNTRLEGESLLPVFPRAEYLVQRMEWADASHPNVRTRATYYPGNFAPLLSEGRMRLLHGEEQLTSHVHCVMTPGHTRGHQSVLLRSGDWRGLFVSDMATFAVHMARAAWVTSFDVEPLENITTKQRWQRWAQEHDAWLFFIHDPLTPVARLVARAGRLDIEPVTEAQALIDSLPTPPPLGG
jgi:glyoxylase-like metal-dependent hydrolase (beta-lactamase superfamily II)